ncbi:MAG: 2-hydroxyglutaryl-CoA dehydratase [Kiritimatiellae bacterium]|nr:2-hydroxyglutaryl-CoA dehydratase [Kiritimatiellia bacterium]
MITAGIDSGSRTVKAVVLDGDTLQVMGTAIDDQGVRQAELAHALLERAAGSAGLPREEIRAVIATGYGRDIVEIAATTVTEITCHARGVRHVSPGARTVIDIGGQDSKVLRLNADGRVRDFATNDRCAAGTGRFLEIVASRLEVGLAQLGEMAGKSARPAPISSMCAVFAETEIIGLLASGTAREDIVAGVQAAIATRVAALAGRQIEEPVLFTGGVALVPGMAAALAAALNHPVRVAPQPQLTGALGAALLAAERR